MRHLRFVAVVAITLSTLLTHAGLRAAAEPAPPGVGDKARDFTLPTVTAKSFSLSRELAAGPVVLVVLRGWPGYQCPFCTRQFADFKAHAKEFEQSHARVVFVYPGPSDAVQQRAREFIGEGALPSNFEFVLDADYGFTLAYGLRWNAPSETAYPSTFVIDRAATLRFAQISRAHDGRARAADVLAALATMGASERPGATGA
jgi:peroxiredoxin